MSPVLINQGIAMTRFLENSQRANDCAANLQIYIERQIRFNGSEPAHVKLVNDCISELTTSLEALQKIDLNMVTGFSVGFGAYIFSYLLPFTTVAIAAIGYGCYQLALRQSANDKYQNALEKLVQCAQWSFNPAASAASASTSGSSGCINKMLETLAPLVPAHTIPGDLERKPVVLDGHQLSKEEQGLYFSVYGYQQGGWLHMFKALVQVVPQAFAKVSTYMPWNNKQAAAATPAPAALAAASVAPKP